MAHGLWQWPGVEALRIHKKKATCPMWFSRLGCWIHGSKIPIRLSILKKQLYYWWRQENSSSGKSRMFYNERRNEIGPKDLLANRFNSLITGLGVEDPPAEDISIQQNLMDEFPKIEE